MFNKYAGAKKDDDSQSQLSAIPPTEIETHLMRIENLEWQLSYERKLS